MFYQLHRVVTWSNEFFFLLMFKCFFNYYTALYIKKKTKGNKDGFESTHNVKNLLKYIAINSVFQRRWSGVCLFL